MSSYRIIRNSIIIFLVLIAMPILLILYLLNSMYTSTLINISADDRLHLLNNISTSVDNDVQQRMLSAINVAANMEILSLANRWHRTQYIVPRLALDTQLRSRLSQPVLLINKSELITFYFKDSDEVFVFGESNFLSAAYARNTSWYKKALNNRGRMIVDSSIGENGNSVSFAINPNTIIANNQIEVIYFRFNVNFIHDYGLDQGGIIIAGPERDIIYCSVGYRLGYSLDDFPLIRGSSTIEAINGEKVLITSATAQRIGWTFISIESFRQITGQVRGVTIYGYIAGSLYLLCFVVFSLLFYKKTIKPALMLELQAMQYQITPHFIINTINSIKIMAMIANQRNIEKMTEAFMRLLSSILGKQGTESSVKEEIENIKHYIHIMKVRFGEKFAVEYDVEPSIEELRVLSFLLQPIVENSIIHGFNEKESDCMISIKGYTKGDRLFFEVWDSGSGMSSVKARELPLRNQKNGNGFLSMGVYNVSRRIKLNYGRNYGLQVESKPEESTCVTFELPIIRPKAGEGK